MSPRRRRRDRNPQVRARQRHEAAARERLERAWYARLALAPELARLVVHREAEAAPLHRWLPYRQGFSPALVDWFLERSPAPQGPILDPFSGSGTTALACARRGRPALAVESIGSLVFLTEVRLRLRAYEQDPSFARGPVPAEPQRAWQQARTPLDRAAVLLAAARTVRADGRPRRDDPDFPTLVTDCATVICQDRAHAPDPLGHAIQADARSLPLRAGAVGGILTSPPYLGRYDYARQVRPLERLWHADHNARPARRDQIPARREARARGPREDLHPAGDEAAQQLARAGRRKEAGLVRRYVAELDKAIDASAAVLAPGALMGLVLAGARFCGTYLPADLLAAERCAACGLTVDELLVARTFGPGRRLGGLEDVAPRETVLLARRPR